MIKTLYAHGLDGLLSEEKKKILELYTQVIAPEMNYRTNPKSYDDLLQIAQKEKVDVIIGSSMGGCMAYHLSLHLNVPALLFNPALPFRSVGVDLPDQNLARTEYLRVILGGKDEIVDPLKNLYWLTEHENGDMDIRWRHTLGHRIPLDVFQYEVGDFFGRIIQ
jgi:uncharacterized protein